MDPKNRKYSLPYNGTNPEWFLMEVEKRIKKAVEEEEKKIEALEKAEKKAEKAAAKAEKKANKQK